VIAEMVVGVAEAVPGAGLELGVAEFLEQVKGLLAVAERLLVIAEPGVEPADRVHGECLAHLVTGGPVLLQRLPTHCGEPSVSYGAGIDGGW
jgi:hypothetical protein